MYLNVDKKGNMIVVEEELVSHSGQISKVKVTDGVGKMTLSVTNALKISKDKVNIALSNAGYKLRAI